MFLVNMEVFSLASDLEKSNAIWEYEFHDIFNMTIVKLWIDKCQ